MVNLKEAIELDVAAKKAIEDNPAAGLLDLKDSKISSEDLLIVVNQKLDLAFVGCESRFNYLRIPLEGKDLLSLSTPESYIYHDYSTLGYGWSRLPGDPAAEGDGARGAFCVSSDGDAPPPGSCPFRLNLQEAQPEETATPASDEPKPSEESGIKENTLDASGEKKAADSEESNADESSGNLVVDVKSDSEDASQKGWESYVSSFSIKLTTCTKDFGDNIQCDPGEP
ncbi:MAG: hypothetical protein ACKO45_14760, partial [Cyanobium sp.]